MHTIQDTINKYRQEVGEEYTSLTEEQALEVVKHEEDLDANEKNSSRRLISVYGIGNKKVIPPFVFVSPRAFTRWRLLGKTMEEERKNEQGNII